MSEFTPLVKSHPSARVRQLLASAELDAPPAGSRERAVVMTSQRFPRATTTNFSGVALGTTVHRLLGAVTLYGSAASPWRLLLRGSVMGATVGAMALATIVGLRWARAPEPNSEEQSAVNATVLANAPSERIANEPNSGATSGHAARDFALLRGAAIELDSARPEAALESIETLLTSAPDPSLLPQATVLKVKALLRLSRLEEAEAAAKPLLSGQPCPEAHEIRALLEAHRSASSGDLAK